MTVSMGGTWSSTGFRWVDRFGKKRNFFVADSTRSASLPRPLECPSVERALSSFLVKMVLPNILLPPMNGSWFNPVRNGPGSASSCLVTGSACSGEMPGFGRNSWQCAGPPGEADRGMYGLKMV